MMATEERPARLLSIPVGVPFLPMLARALRDGTLVPGFRDDGDPLALASVTIYVPTRRAARELRAAFVAEIGAGSAILPTIRPLGEFEEDAQSFEPGAAALSLAPPIAAIDRLLMLAPLVQAWKSRIPAHIAARFGEDVTVPASAADAVWLAGDLAALIDEIETDGGDWSRLAGLVPDELAGWWQITLEFLSIVTDYLPAQLAERQRSSPGAHRSAMIDAEAARIARNPPPGPVIAAGSTGSIPATARLLAAIARCPQGAVVLPGLDKEIDARAWAELGRPDAPPSTFGHPQYGLHRLLARLEVSRESAIEIAAARPDLAARARFVSDALRPAETTDLWQAGIAAGLDGVALVEAANEREEAQAIAVALRHAVSDGNRSAALVTPDRELARRVAVALQRFGITADDSGGRALAATPPATLLSLAIAAGTGEVDPVGLLSLVKHPLLRCGMPRGIVRSAAETIDLIAFRGGAGRPVSEGFPAYFDARLAALRQSEYAPFWLRRIGEAQVATAQRLLQSIEAALVPLRAMAGREVSVPEAAAASVRALEALGCDETGDLGPLYVGEAGEALAQVLRELCAAGHDFTFAAREWPAILDALLAGAMVKPRPGADQRVAIWGTLEARLQSVDTLVIGGLNEGSWPRRATADRFMSRVMKAGLELAPPERRIGQAAHDFTMAMGMPEVVLTRALRSGDSPSIASRWLQRMTAIAGADETAAMRRRGARFIAWGRALEAAPPVTPAPRPEPRPPVDLRPKRFSVTEVETLRRDPYAVYARRILRLRRIDPLVRDPDAIERGNLFHDILHAFALSGADPHAPDAEARLIAAGRTCFAAEVLPRDIVAVWWPRFMAMVPHFILWERSVRPHGIVARLAEAKSKPVPIGISGVTLSGRADRIDLHAGGVADILDFKTGSSPTKAQAHTLLSPQLALEGALLMRGGFEAAGQLMPADLAYVRLKANGEVKEESVLEYKKTPRSADDLAEDAWRRLELLVAHYKLLESGYKSRALPFREGDMDGEYDHLARVLEWSAGASDEGDDA